MIENLKASLLGMALIGAVRHINPKGRKPKMPKGGTERAKIIGRMIAAGELNANDAVTWGQLSQVMDVAENNSHGKARRAELVEKGVLEK